MGSPADGLFNAQLWQSIAPPGRTPGHNLRAQVTVRGILSTADGYRVGRAGPNMRVLLGPNRSSGDGGTESTTAPTTCKPDRDIHGVTISGPLPPTLTRRLPIVARSLARRSAAQMTPGESSGNVPRAAELGTLRLPPSASPSLPVTPIREPGVPIDGHGNCGMTGGAGPVRMWWVSPRTSTTEPINRAAILLLRGLCRPVTCVTVKNEIRDRHTGCRTLDFRSDPCTESATERKGALRPSIGRFHGSAE